MEENKKIKVIAYPNLRDVVDYANELHVSKEDIISVVHANGQFCLIYFK